MNARIASLLIAVLLALLVMVPLAGIPADTGGIPLWYQSTFFYSLVVLGIAGGITSIGYFTGFLDLTRWNYLDGMVLALFLYMVIRILLMEFIPQSVWIQLACLSGVYFIARILWSHINTYSFHVLLIILLMAGSIEALYGLGQLYGLLPSHHQLFAITGSFFNPGPYSGWLACMIPVAVYGVFQKNGSKIYGILNYVSWIYLVVAILVMVPASSRAAILAAFAGTMVLIWARLQSFAWWKRPWIRGVLAMIIISGCLGLYLMKKDSADGRLLIYKVTADMIAEAPVLGWGWDGFPGMYNNFQSQYFQEGKGSEREKYLAGDGNFGFNEVLVFTAEMGLIGLFLLAGIAVFLVRKWRYRSKRPNGHSYLLPGMAVMASWCTFALFSYPLSIPALAMIFPFTLAGINTTLNMERSGEIDRAGSKKGVIHLLRTTIPGILIIGISVYSLYWVYHYRPLAQEWMKANIHQDHQRYEMANNLYRELFPHFKNEGMFLQYAGKSMSLDRKYNESADMLEKALCFSADPVILTTLGHDYGINSRMDMEKKKRAEYLLTRAKYISPYKYYPRFLLAKYYLSIGRKQSAIEEARSLLAIPPKVTSPATRDIRQQMQQIIDQNTFPAEQKQPQ